MKGKMGLPGAVLCTVLLVVSSAPAVWADTAVPEESPAQEAEPKTAEEVLERMAEARKAIRMASYKIRRQKRYVRPVYGEIDTPTGTEFTDEVIVPAGTLTVHAERFFVDGARYRYETEGPIPNIISGPAGPGLGPAKHVLVYDGEHRWEYNPRGEHCGLAKGPALNLFMLLRPFMHFHYGVEAVAGQRPDVEFKLLGLQEWKGQQCYSLVKHVGDHRCSYLVDPAQDWIVVWEQVERQNPQEKNQWTTWHEAEMQYVRDDNGAWRLSATP